MSTITKNLGIVAPVPKDEWIANKIYEPLNIVRHTNATYIAKKENSNIEPNSTTNWQDFWQPLVYDGITDGNQDIHGIKTFYEQVILNAGASAPYESITEDNDITNKLYVDNISATYIDVDLLGV